MIRFHKVLATLPGSIEPDSLYAIRRGPGFDLAVTDDSGDFAFFLNLDAGESGSSSFRDTNPTFVYTQGRLTSINYASGGVKTFEYNEFGQLSVLIYSPGNEVAPIIKNFQYGVDGSLTSITESEGT